MRYSEVFDLRPARIIERLDLKRPIYRETIETVTSTESPQFTWETDMVDAIRKRAGL